MASHPVPPAMERPHFLGIGGAGMSGIAKVLAQRGARVTGSDARESETVEALRRLGVTVRIGHAAEHLPADATCIVASSAIRDDNPEIAAATERGLPVVHRSDALAALLDGHRAVAVAGTHGKTTTTSMLAVALRTLGADPSYAIGGDLDQPGSNAHQGGGDLFVAEADESDRSFHKYAPEVAVVLNVELDHHANYASLEEVHESFEIFAGRVREGGTLVVSADDPGAREFAARVRAAGGAPRVVTYGQAEDAEVRVVSIEHRGLASRVTAVLDGRELAFEVSVPGRHYALNAVAALAAGAAAGVDPEELAPALQSFHGVGRRLQSKGESGGVQVIDSYAHHPTEMAADLEAVRQAAGEGRVLVVYQPHLFSRTRELGVEMGRALALADASVVLPIYPAREDPLPGVTSGLVVEAALGAGADVTETSGPEEAVGVVAGMTKPGDLVLTMGAGDVTELGPQLLARLGS
ncbi:UDP-N-acetylmuramate--L-alanine ligase [Streptomyces xiaopingdaonensis]|uniref:UDP-N-acetylmuramate--L-alanine ligase n=1 Tax=Streptomyces xiaopingdaonensis TaxID=1565415 RepID=UPI0004941D71|nr:UDP-N-acetylmuramate--L-alanine ligase [Streptomyces xiaopingdaonensis]